MALGWLWWRAWFPFAAVVAAAVCVAGAALGDIDLRFAGRCGPWLHQPSLCMAGVALLALHGLALVTRLVPVSRRCRRGRLRGRRGTWWHRPSLCVAGVALGYINQHFVCQAWRLWHWAGSGDALGSRLPPLSPRPFAWQAWHLVTSTVTLRGKRGTWWHRTVTLRGRRDTWWHRTFTLRGRPGAWRRLVASTITLRGRRGTYMALGWLWWRAWLPFCRRCRRGPFARQASRLNNIHVTRTCQFAWQAWHLWHWAGSGDALGSRLPPLSPRPFAWEAWHLVTSTVTLHGRRGTSGTAWASSGDALGSRLPPLSPRPFAWQAWHLVTSTVTLRDRCGTWWHQIVTLRGRRGTSGTGLALVTRLVPVCRCYRRSRLRGRRGTWWHRPSFCQAWYLVTSNCHCAWQAWHLWHWGGSGDALGSRLLPFVAAAVCVAGVALGDIDRHFAWQVWHLVTSTVTLHGRRGTWWHRPSLCLAGVLIQDFASVSRLLHL